MLPLLKKRGNVYLRLFLPSWAGKDVAPVPPGDGSSSVSAVKISDWLMLPFVSLQYMSAWLLLEFEEVFGAHSSPGCFFWISVGGKRRGWGFVMEESHDAWTVNWISTLTSTTSGNTRSWKTSLSSTVSKNFKQKEVPGWCLWSKNFKEYISPFQLDTTLSRVKQLSVSRFSCTSATSL